MANGETNTMLDQIHVEILAARSHETEGTGIHSIVLTAVLLEPTREYPLLTPSAVYDSGSSSCAVLSSGKSKNEVIASPNVTIVGSR